MSDFKYEDVVPSFVPGTTIKKVLIDGVHKFYNICANDGYVLHDSRGDGVEEDFVTPIEYFSNGTVSVRHDYDFENTAQATYNGNTVTKYGKYNLYALPEHNIFNEVNKNE